MDVGLGISNMCYTLHPRHMIFFSKKQQANNVRPGFNPQSTSHNVPTKNFKTYKGQRQTVSSSQQWWPDSTYSCSAMHMHIMYELVPASVLLQPNGGDAI